MPNSRRCIGCNPMKPCKCKGIHDLLKGRPFSRFFKYLRRTAERRRSTRRFRSVHAVFWPLMSMRSDERERTAEHPSLALTEIEIESTDQTVPAPVPVQPIHPPVTSSCVAAGSTTPPVTSSNTKVEPNHPSPPPPTSSTAKVEPITRLSRLPITSPYKNMAAQMKKVEERTTKEDTHEVLSACRSFEKYLMEMLVEERKVRDLLDVEELMYCMDKLQSPAFVELVCTFYGELCMDLFINEADQPIDAWGLCVYAGLRLWAWSSEVIHRSTLSSCGEP